MEDVCVVWKIECVRIEILPVLVFLLIKEGKGGKDDQKETPGKERERKIGIE